MTTKPTTTAEKVKLLTDLAKRVSTELPAGDDLQRRSIHLASSLYKNRTGRIPTQRIREIALAIKWEA